MSQGYACEDRGAHRAAGAWIVLVRNANHSAFNGGRRTPSAYSAVACTRCGRIWRTKARYVGTLRDGSWKELEPTRISPPRIW
jgi:hypothetical protein